MTVSKQTITDIDLDGKAVLVRVDFNVPFRPDTSEVADDTRIEAALPTLRYLIERRCRLVLCSHLGRPAGRVVKALRMGPVTQRVSELLGLNVAQAGDYVGQGVRDMAAGLAPGGAMMLENLRFHPGEEANAPEFGADLASLADVYVNDAFGAAHRVHASTVGVAGLLPAVAGLLMDRELEMLDQVLGAPQRPFVAILGGAKVSDKIAAAGHLAAKVDTLMLGGGMSPTFLMVKGLEVGDSPVEEALVPAAEQLIATAESRGTNILLPTDVVVAGGFSESASHRVVRVDQIPPGWQIMDIGPRTASGFEAALRPAETVVWNGPVGVFEWDAFSQGTARIASAVAGLTDATTVIGGGSTAEAVAALGLQDKMTHVSTGGGASLDFLAGKTLPGVAALRDKDQ